MTQQQTQQVVKEKTEEKNLKDSDKSESVQKYFAVIDKGIEDAYTIANAARKKGFDPEKKVDIPLVQDMAERVEGVISVVAPQIIGSGVAERIKELEKQYGSLDWRISLIIALEIAQEKFCKFKDKKEAIEIGIRAGFTYHTMGVVSSPLEGFVELQIKQTQDGKEYFAIQYAGPIRSAGGTGSSVSALIVDYVRKKMGYAKYDPTPQEIKRAVQDLYDYHERVTNLQYLPSEEEIEFLVKHLPVQIDGPASEKIEVWNYRDLPRVETNKIRNGPCLVIGEGIAQKAPKLWAQLSKWGSDFDLDDWNFIKEFLVLQKNIKSKGQTKTDDKKEITPDYTFIKDLVAGRPVFTHPLEAGGFRLRFGRSRTSGFSAASVHPATMFVLNEYIATGTQLKVERPGKAACVTACDTIEGPIVKMKDGSVLQLHALKEAKEKAKEIEKILFLGDILISYGDFFNRAHTLVPPGYCEEWWFAELEQKIKDKTKETTNNKQQIEIKGFKNERIQELFSHPLYFRPTAQEALFCSQELSIPLHPLYTYHWKLLNQEKALSLLLFLQKANILKNEEGTEKITVIFNKEKNKQEKETLEEIGIPHLLVNEEYIIFERDVAIVLDLLFGLENKEKLQNIIGDVNKLSNEKSEFKNKKDNGDNLKFHFNFLDILNKYNSITIKDKSGIFIGARMGRPEKAKMRKLTGSPQVLFPVGDEGGRLRCFQSSLEAGKVTAEFPLYYCENCELETIYPFCDQCTQETIKRFYCRICKKTISLPTCPQHGEAVSYKKTEINIADHFKKTLQKLNTKVYPDLIKGVKGTSNKEHTPEHLVKGILRARHDVYVNKDGTTRYDMTQLPITHFKPKEIGTSIEKLKELGYLKDIYAKPLENKDQILELKPQDIILPACDSSPDEGADNAFFNVANFIDDLLENFYKLPRFYNLKTKQDLVGHLTLALAPHTCAGITTRIIGFSKTQAFFAHPLIHAATRRDCDGDEACVTLLLDALLNFSRQFLPAHRGSTQDAPLVLTARLNPAEVDDMVFDMDVAFSYPLAFYQASEEYKNPWDVKIDQISQRLGTHGEYEGMGFTHDTTDINETVRCAAYKTLPSMEDKLKGQMDLAVRIRAVNTSDVARLVIEKHFLKDTKGNLRKFSMQKFRCVACNEKFRRPPLTGACTKCKGKIIFTISEGSVVKYLEPMLSLADTYNVSPYLKQSLELLQRRVESVFGKEKEKQMGLGRWFG